MGRLHMFQCKPTLQLLAVQISSTKGQDMHQLYYWRYTHCLSSVSPFTCLPIHLQFYRFLFITLCESFCLEAAKGGFCQFDNGIPVKIDTICTKGRRTLILFLFARKVLFTSSHSVSQLTFSFCIVNRATFWNITTFVG